MGHSKDNKKTKIIPDLERVVPDEINVYSRRLLQEHIDRYKFAVPYIHNKVAVDVACGSGYGSHRLACKGAKKIIGVDCDNKTIKYAKARYPRRNIIYKVGDAINLPITSSSVDAVVSFETIEHIKKPLTFLKEAKRVLRQSGLLIISTPNKKYSIGDNPFHYKEYNLWEFNKIISRYFRSIIYYGQRPVFRPLMFIYRILSQVIPISLHPLLHMRPWEKLDIRKIVHMDDDGYVYFIALCKK